MFYRPTESDPFPRSARVRVVSPVDAFDRLYLGCEGEFMGCLRIGGWAEINVPTQATSILINPEALAVVENCNRLPDAMSVEETR